MTVLVFGVLHSEAQIVSDVHDCVFESQSVAVLLEDIVV
jgi:hypothetical protein